MQLILCLKSHQKIDICFPRSYLASKLNLDAQLKEVNDFLIDYINHVKESYGII